jgi:hypothetical protein
VAFGRLSLAQETAIKPLILASLVHDLGAGDLTLATTLLHLGAHQVIAIDKAPYRKRPPQGINTVTCYFENYPAPIDIAFVSWPRESFDLGLLSLIRRSRIVIYLGCNTGGSACGFSLMWQHLATREVIAYVPEAYNSLVIYGSTPQQRAYLPEEYAAIFQDKMWSFNDIHQIADTLPQVNNPASPRGN